MSFKNSNSSILVKSPNEAFDRCPVCRIKDLKTLGEDVYCRFCGWDSVEAHGKALADLGYWIIPPENMEVTMSNRQQ